MLQTQSAIILSLAMLGSLATHCRAEEAFPQEAFQSLENVQPVGYEPAVVGTDYFDGQYPVSAYNASRSTPRFSVKTDLMLLARVDNVGGDFFFDANSFNFFDPSTYQPLGDLDGLTGELKPGFRVSITDHNEDGSATELSFFQMEKFGDSYTVTSPDPITFVFHFTVPANPRNSYDLSYASRFRGVELNRKKQIASRFTGIAGVRYVQLSESFNISGDGNAGDSKMDNELYGLQLGGDLKLFHIGRVEFGATVKGGGYFNHGHVHAAVVSAATNNRTTFVDNEDEFAFVGEAMIGAFIPMGPKANIRIGYQGFYLDGIGLAPDQADEYSVFAQSGSLDARDVWFHGGYIGMEFFW